MARSFYFFFRLLFLFILASVSAEFSMFVVKHPFSTYGEKVKIEPKVHLLKELVRLFSIFYANSVKLTPKIGSMGKASTNLKNFKKNHEVLYCIILALNLIFSNKAIEKFPSFFTSRFAGFFFNYIQ